MDYLYIIEETSTGYSAYFPDLPGCISVGETLEELERNLKEAVELHLQGMREEGLTIPEPNSAAKYLTLPLTV